MYIRVSPVENIHILDSLVKQGAEKTVDCEPFDYRQFWDLIECKLTAIRCETTESQPPKRTFCLSSY